VIDIKTSFKPIVLILPAGIEVQGTARTNFGKITFDFPVTILDGGEFVGRAVKFETGKNAVVLKLETSAGITVKRG
jgi:hypothetical protein